MKNMRLGEMLVQAGALTEEQVNEALQKQIGTGKRLGAVLIEEGYITEDQLIDVLRMQLGIEFIDLNKTKIDPEMATIVPRNIARTNRVVPVRMYNNKLYLAMEDPLNFRAIEAVKEKTRKKVVPLIAYSNAISRALSVVYENEGAALAMKEMAQERSLTIGEKVNEQKEKEEAASAPTVKLVTSILERAVAEKASDIHIEPREEEMVVRMRVDGKLQQILTIPKELQSAVLSRFKVMGSMNITERRIPQDGRAVMHRAQGEDIDLRLNTLPTIFGEKLVIRILWRDEQALTRKGIGISEADNGKFDKILHNTSGLILIVGPTGSGKTSTLYTMIRELNKPDVNMISLEDPVEFHMDGVTQVAINEKVGLTFASSLRACLRQDPDIICVGEIRDGETAEIAMRAAMTGHLVLSTIHTEDTISAIDRLKDLGVEPYLIASSLRGVISQRLVRKICPKCRKEVSPNLYDAEIAGITHPEKFHFYKGTGCPMCFGTGYRSRTGVFEILTMDARVREAISQGANSTELRKVITQRADFTSMLANARTLIETGVTTVEEVVRQVVSID